VDRFLVGFVIAIGPSKPCGVKQDLFKFQKAHQWKAGGGYFIPPFGSEIA